MIMAASDPTAIPDPTPKPQADGSSTLGPAAPSPAQLVYWSLRRELWENRFIYIVPLIVAAVFLVAFAIGAIHIPLKRADGSPTPLSMRALEGPYDFASLVLMLTYLVVAVIYCLGALHNERQDRSILFWKSLPVSDVTTVLAKATIPIIVIPLITFVILVVTQGIMFVIGSAVLLGRGGHAAGPWSQVPLLPLWAAMLYHLLTVHALYYAPIYGWFMLVSGWARRAVFLWAVLPVLAVLIIEKLVFNTSGFAHLLVSRLEGGPAAIPFPPPGHMPMEAPTFANLGSFLASPGLWIGFAVCAVFLAAAVRLRRYQGPI
jgi:ABC-2 type transport system permease protein